MLTTADLIATYKKAHNQRKAAIQSITEALTQYTKEKHPSVSLETGLNLLEAVKKPSHKYLEHRLWDKQWTNALAKQDRKLVRLKKQLTEVYQSKNVHFDRVTRINQQTIAQMTSALKQYRHDRNPSIRLMDAFAIYQQGLLIQPTAEDIKHTDWQTVWTETIEEEQQKITPLLAKLSVTLQQVSIVYDHAHVTKNNLIHALQHALQTYEKHPQPLHLLKQCLQQHTACQKVEPTTSDYANREWKPHWTRDLSAKNKTIAQLIKQVQQAHRTISLETNLLSVAEQAMKDRAQHIATLNDDSVPFQQKILLVNLHPFENYTQKYGDLFVSEKKTTQLNEDDARYECLTNFILAMQTRHKMVLSLSDTKTSLADKAQTVAHYYKSKKLASFNPAPLSDEQKDALDNLEQDIINLLPEFNKQRKNEIEHRKNKLQVAFIPALNAFAQKTKQLQIAIKTLSEQAKSLVPVSAQAIKLREELFVLQNKYDVASHVFKQLMKLKKNYISDHKITVQAFKQQVVSITDDEIILHRNSSIERVDVKDVLCQHQDSWGFKSIIDAILSSVGLSYAASFFKPDTARKLCSIEHAVQGLPKLMAGP